MTQFTANLDKLDIDLRKRMKKYADPVTGTISYSGADFKAIVFMPMSLEKIAEKVESLHAQIFSLEKKLSGAKGLWYTLSEEYRAAVIANNTSQAALYRKRLNQTMFRQIENMENQLGALNDEVKRTENAITNNTDYAIKPILLADAQTISYSSHRVKIPVRPFGYVSPKSFTRGVRTIAGSIIFTLFNKHALWELLETSRDFYNTGVFSSGSDSSYPELTTVLVDQLPPFDITLIGANEIGDMSYMTLYGVEIMNEGFTVSIQDIITENVMQYVARDFDPMRPINNKRIVLELGEEILSSADNLLDAKRDELAARKARLNPFI